MTTVCYAMCWACKFDSHFDEPTPHTWMDDEDLMCSRDAARLAALTTAQLAAERPCACRCAGGPGGCRVIGQEQNDD
jgi:hypothetical protein